jgi:hypothetical protein
MASQMGEQGMQSETTTMVMSVEWETTNLLHLYVCKNLFTVFKFAYSDGNFHIGGKVWDHYKNRMTGILTRHILVEADT